MFYSIKISYLPDKARELEYAASNGDCQLC